MQVDEAVPLTKRPAGWKLALNLALPVILLAVFAWQIHKSWPDIRDYNWALRWDLVALALVVLLINSALEVAIWNRTLAWFTDVLPFRLAVPVYIWSSLARYIPGKVASLVIRAGLAKEANRDIVPVLASSTVELALRTASGLFLFLVALLVWHISASTKMLAPALAVIPLVLICAHPKIMLPVMNWALVKIKQPTITHTLGYGEVLGIFAATVIRWAFYGFAFALLACAIYPTAADHIPVLIGTAAGSWAAGFVGMSPGGLGLAEWVQKVILQESLHFPLEVALVLPVLFRLGTLLAEGAWALVSVVLWRARA
ncbi:MAG TPA: hypothetical protein VGL77_20000 [Armatimonadota bacterium]|jgi:hypothetical protein